MQNKIILLIIFIFFTGCEKNPVKKLINPADSNAIGIWDTNGDWVIYDDEIKTGGAILFFNSLDNQVLDFNCRDNPHSGSKCLKYSWNGKDVYAYGATPGLEHDYCGFSLTASKDVNSYLTATRDISGGTYTKISFWARGDLNTFVYLRLEGNNGTDTSLSGTDAWMSSDLAPVTSSWQKYEFNITGNMTAIKDFVKIVLKYNEGVSPNTVVGNGGTVFIDDIKLTH
ncbi:MAG: hypothetical protein LHV68_10570 [Elusimicrobia bacterium]|nr:hypothetical protein [Candidatus Liberimonas magnetica]